MCTRRTRLISAEIPRHPATEGGKENLALCLRVSVARGCLLAVVFASTVTFAQNSLNSAQGTPNLGRPVSEADIAAWDISILPDGTGLPAGSGTPEQGAKIFATKCALCHGPEGKGGTAAAVVGGAPLERGVRHVLRDFAGGPHIFNLGHGITPDAKPEHVETLLRLVREA